MKSTGDGCSVGVKDSPYSNNQPSISGKTSGTVGGLAEFDYSVVDLLLSSNNKLTMVFDTRVYNQPRRDVLKSAQGFDPLVPHSTSPPAVSDPPLRVQDYYLSERFSLEAFGFIVGASFP